MDEEQRLREKVRGRYRRWKEDAEFWDKHWDRPPTLPDVKTLEDFVVSKYREGFRCYYCGRKMEVEWKDVDTWNEATSWALEHKTPHVHKGDDRLENLVVACDGCNIVKGSMRAETYSAVFHRLPLDVRLKWLNESYKGWKTVRKIRVEEMRVIKDLLRVEKKIPMLSAEAAREVADLLERWIDERLAEHE